MSDSSEDEDLSRFKEVVDISFTKLLQETENKPKIEKQKLKSERYLEESSHYNDVKIPEKMQNQIGSKISMIINKNIEFVEVELPKINSRLILSKDEQLQACNTFRKPNLKGGVKLFNSSNGFLSCEEVKDVYTDLHNSQSKSLRKRKRQIDENNDLSENDKISAVVVCGEDIILKNDTKLWRSRRKEKLFKYKRHGKSRVLMAVD